MENEENIPTAELILKTIFDFKNWDTNPNIATAVLRQQFVTAKYLFIKKEFYWRMSSFKHVCLLENKGNISLLNLV